MTDETAMGTIPSSSELTEKEKLYRYTLAKALANRGTARPTPKKRRTLTEQCPDDVYDQCGLLL